MDRACPAPENPTHLRFCKPDRQHPPSKLEQKFNERVHDETLKPLLGVIQGLMTFMPSDRISASQALGLIQLK